MTRFEATYNWLKPIFERIIEVQKHGGLIFDEDNEILKQLAFDKENMIYMQDGKTRVIYYGDGWTDENTETKKYWRAKLRQWRFVVSECLQKVEL